VLPYRHVAGAVTRPGKGARAASKTGSFLPAGAASYRNSYIAGGLGGAGEGFFPAIPVHEPNFTDLQGHPVGGIAGLFPALSKPAVAKAEKTRFPL
jgi:hypothetical protein